MSDIKDIFKGELVLSRDSKNQQLILRDKEALAQVVQNIIFLEKGTLPNQPELGVGIENYLFEKLTEETLNTLKVDIENQITKFIPTLYDVDIEIEANKNNTSHSLFIAISIKHSSTMGDIDETLIGVAVGKNNNSDKVISQLMIG